MVTGETVTADDATVEVVVVLVDVGELVEIVVDLVEVVLILEELMADTMLKF